jgi:hypothetical protein
MALILDGTTGVPVTTVTGTLPVANGGSGVTTSTGTGANVLGTSPTLVTPLLGTPTSGNLANCTGIPAPAALSTASGSAPSYSARAWVNFNGTGTVAIRGSVNVSSVTDDATGQYTVNFTTAMVDVNYSATGAVSDLNAPGANEAWAMLRGGFATTSCPVDSVGYNSASLDVPYNCWVFFR